MVQSDREPFLRPLMTCLTGLQHWLKHEAADHPVAPHLFPTQVQVIDHDPFLWRTEQDFLTFAQADQQ